MPARKRVSRKKTTYKKTPKASYSSQVAYAGSGYGKRPLWQWVVIYLLVAVVVYYLIYYFFLNKGTSYQNSGTSLTQPTQQTQPYSY